MAGYKAWQKNFERHVNKGEKAIRILAPAPYKIKEERDKIDPVTQEIMLDRDGNPQKEEVEITIPAFRAVSVFDVSQTDEKPIPELEAKELLSDVEGYQDMIHAVEAVSPVPIEMEEIAGESKGYFDREARRIAVPDIKDHIPGYNKKVLHTPTMRIPQPILDPRIIYTATRSTLVEVIKNRFLQSHCLRLDI